MYQALHAALIPGCTPPFIEASRQAFFACSALIARKDAKGIWELRLGGEIPLDGGDDGLDVLFQGVDDAVGSSVERVAREESASGFERGPVELFNERDERARDVVEVKDGWGGIEAYGVEVVGVSHGDSGECMEVFGFDGGFHLGHPARDDGQAMLE